MAKFMVPAKRFYKIGEVSKLIGEPASTIRFWEKEFKQLKPKKNNKGQRVFSDKDIEILKFIKSERDKGLTLEGIKRKLEGEKSIIKQNSKIKEELRIVKSELEKVLKILRGLK